MTSLSFPDVNVWISLLLADHVHRASAVEWWESETSETIAFCRMTQISVLRLLTTAIAMNGKPLSMKDAWRAYERLFADARVAFVPEPDAFEQEFKRRSSSDTASPKVWADAYLIALATCTDATIVTFDQAFREQRVRCLVLR
jgi:toxin-antitoxin system PIN domain toxin